MKKIFFVLFVGIISSEVFAQNKSDFRNEFSTEIGSYQGNSMPNAYFFRQKYTHWFSRHIGVSVSNMRSNQTFDIPAENYTIQNTTNIAKLRQVNNRYLDLSLATKFTIKNHEIRLASGVSANRYYQMRVSEKEYFADLQQKVLVKYNAADVKVENLLIPQLSVGYA
ncbi:MAG: hypothetical protein ACOVO2_13170, partial [Emticicia sp.]|uniref:hypothetical protein n=1 Tax=Emticicia sp. TaxID=1930953 RepID=UPI003BA73D52